MEMRREGSARPNLASQVPGRIGKMADGRHGQAAEMSRLKTFINKERLAEARDSNSRRRRECPPAGGFG